MSMSEFEKYKGLFAEGGDFDIPATANVGLAFKPSKDSAVLFDIQQIWYSDVAAVGNPIKPLTDGSCIPGPTGGTGAGCLGGSSGAGFGWDDITVYKLGYQFHSSPDWLWRVGYSYNTQPIPESEVLFNILAPGVQQHHITFGFTNQLSKTSEWTFSAMYSPETKVSGTSPFDPAQTIELKMHQFDIGAAYSWKF
jgi:long-chain fatty acid transport protein